MPSNLRVLLLTSEWPSAADPHRVPFLVQNVEHLQRAGVAITVFSFRGGKSPANYLKAWRALRQTHNLRDYDLLHAHFGQSGTLAIPSPRPLVVTFHGSDLQGVVGADGNYTRSSGPQRAASRLAARYARENIVVSRRLLPYLPPLKKPAHVIPLGVDFSRFALVPRDEARRQLGLPLDKRLILFGASPTNAVKRFSLAQAAVEPLKSKWDVELLTLAGREHAQVPLWMNACDVLLLTSRHEGSPTVVKEALACNLPIVSTDVGDVRERVANVPGCVVCDDTPHNLTRALEEVLATPSRVAARTAVTELDESLIVQRIIQVYESAVAPS